MVHVPLKSFLHSSDWLFENFSEEKQIFWLSVLIFTLWQNSFKLQELNYLYVFNYFLNEFRSKSFLFPKNWSAWSQKNVSRNICLCCWRLFNLKCQNYFYSQNDKKFLKHSFFSTALKGFFIPCIWNFLFPFNGRTNTHW